MKNTYPKALAFVLRAEGSGYEDVPNDSGGPTNTGLTWRDIAQHRGINPATITTHAQEVHLAKGLTQTELAAIYKGRYWDAVRGDELPWPLDMIVFDCAVNNGVGTAAKLLFRAVGQAPETHISDTTILATLGNEGDHLSKVIENLLSERVAYYHAIVQAHPQDRKFLHGWLNRAENLKEAIA